MDRLKKALYLFPLMPIIDLVSIFWAISFGALVVNPLPLFFASIFGNMGLVIHTTLYFFLNLILVKLALYWRSTFDLRRASLRFGLVFFFVFIFVATAFWFSVAIHNFVIPLSLSNSQDMIVQIISEISIFLGVLWFTRNELASFLPRRARELTQMNSQLN